MKDAHFSFGHTIILSIERFGEYFTVDPHRPHLATPGGNSFTTLPGLGTTVSIVGLLQH